MSTACIDYLSIRFCSIEDPRNVISVILDMNPDSFIKTVGRYGYEYRYSLDNEISVYAGGSEQMGVLLEMSGTGCARYCLIRRNSFALLELLLKVEANDAVTRIDWAVDDRSGLVDMDMVYKKIENKELRTKLKTETHMQSHEIQTGKIVGQTIYLGSKESNFRIRIYDKAAEQQETDGTPWIRTESVFRKEEADRLARMFVKLVKSGMTQEEQWELFSRLCSSVVLRKVAFIDERKSNISRSQTCQWWSDLLGTSEKIPRASLGTVKSVKSAAKWVRSCISASLVALTLVLGSEWLVDILCEGLIRNHRPKSPLKAYRQTAPGANCGTIPDEAVFLSDLSEAINKRQFGAS